MAERFITLVGGPLHGLRHWLDRADDPDEVVIFAELPQGPMRHWYFVDGELGRYLRSQRLPGPPLLAVT